MRKALLTLILLLTLLPAMARAVSPPITLTVDMKQAVPEGQPVVLMLALRNSGAEGLLIGYSASEPSSFQITIRAVRPRNLLLGI